MKICKKCNKEKSSGQYCIYGSNNKPRGTCIECMNIPRKEYSKITTKKCSICKNNKAISNFNRNNLSKTGYSSYCKLCDAERMSKFKINSYGITLVEHLNLLREQDYKCAICNKRVSNRELSIDHNHITGKVRGLLCNNCNAGLGMFKDDTDLLLIAAAYLERDNLS